MQALPNSQFSWQPARIWNQMRTVGEARKEIVVERSSAPAMTPSVEHRQGFTRSLSLILILSLLLRLPSPILSGYSPLYQSASDVRVGLASVEAVESEPVALRDITVAPGESTATITFLVSGAVKTVVVEKKEKNIAQIRMKSMSATEKALKSALPKPDLLSVEAHIERTDVMVANVRFAREVKSLTVTKRDNEQVVVRVTLGGRVSGAPSAPVAPASTEGTSSWKLSTIVIDAGHGGKDPGAIGIGDVKEKDVTLAVAKLLRDELKKTMPKVKIVMTRDDDRFVELYRRGEIANEKGGRLFISIHCNSMPEKPNPANGFECWILRPGKSDDAARVASHENGVIRYESDRKRYDSLDAEIAILGSLAQSAFARYSEQLADKIRSSMKGNVGIADRGVHQAGFYVLVGASMPAVLVELGYLSNEQDAKVLKGSSGQKKIATAIAKGIKNFEKAYSESLQ